MKFALSDRTWILLSTTIIICVVFAYYFLVYVKGNERELVEKNFRVLQQIVQNIHSLDKSFFKNADSILKNQNRTGEQKKSESNEKIKIVSQDRTNNLLKTWEISSLKALDSIFYADDGIYFKVTNETLFYTAYNVFFENELFDRKDVFDQIVVYKATRNNNNNKQIDREVLYSSSPIAIMDSIFHQAKMREAKDRIKLNDKKYISFNQEVAKSHGKTSVFISGLVLESSFERKKRSVSPVVIFFLTTALILIIISMPILKLKIMSMEERLHVKDVVFNIVSMLIGPALFIVFLYTVQIFFGEDSRQFKQKLRDLSNKIEENFQRELSQVIDQADTLNYHSAELDTLVKSYAEDSIFSFERLDSIGLSKLLGHPINPNKDTVRKFSNKGYLAYENVDEDSLLYYKHPKDAFWLTAEGKVMVYLTQFDNPSFPYDLSHRNYVMNIVKGEPSYFTDINEKDHEIGIESIKSVMDGAYEVGIGLTTNTDFLRVLAISTKASSVMGTILDEGYGFCILDKDGNTVFHSDITKNMNENFLEETDNVFDESIISHTGVIKTVDYQGMKQKVYFRPMNCLTDHYIATFMNNQLQYGPFTLSMISSFTFFLSFLCVLFLLYILMYFTSLKQTKLKQLSFIFFFVRPYETDELHQLYKKITKVSYLVAIYLIFSMALNLRHHDFIVTELIFILSILLISSFYALSRRIIEQNLLDRGLREPRKHFYGIALLLLVLIMGIRTVFYLCDLDWEQVLVLFANMSLIVATLWISKNQIIKLSIRSDVSGAEGRNRVWLQLVLLILGCAAIVSITTHKLQLTNHFFLLLNIIVGLRIALLIISILFINDHINWLGAHNGLLKSLTKLWSISDFRKEDEGKLKTAQSDYLRFVIIWIVLFSIIPINLFIQTTYQKEKQILGKFRGLQVSRLIENWETKAKKEFEHKFEETNRVVKYNKYIKSMQMGNINFALVDAKSKDTIRSYHYLKEEYAVIGDSIFAWKDISPNLSKKDEFKFIDPKERTVKKYSYQSKSLPRTLEVTAKDTTYWISGENFIGKGIQNVKLNATEGEISFEIASEGTIEAELIGADSLKLLRSDLSDMLNVIKNASDSLQILSSSRNPDTSFVHVAIAELKNISKDLGIDFTKITNMVRKPDSIKIMDTWYVGKEFSKDGKSFIIEDIINDSPDTLSLKLSSQYHLTSKEDAFLLANDHDTCRPARDKIEVHPTNIAKIDKKTGAVSFYYIGSSEDSDDAEEVIFSELFDSWYFIVRPNYNSRAEATRSFIHNMAADSTWEYLTGKQGNMIMTGLGPSSKFKLKIETARADFFRNHPMLVFFVSILTIIIFYALLKFNLVKVYGFNYKTYAGRSKLDKVVQTVNKFISYKPVHGTNSYNNIFMVGVNSANSSYIESLLTKKQVSFRTLDFYDLNEKVSLQLCDKDETEAKGCRTQFEKNWATIFADIQNWKSNDSRELSHERYVLIEHFEFAYNDLSINKKKLFILKNLLSCNAYKVLVKSEINATKQLEFYHGEIKRLNYMIKNAGVDHKEGFQKEMNELRIEYKTWQHLLGSFVKIVTPIQQNLVYESKRNIMDKELAHGEFLGTIRPYLESSFDMPMEDQILTIQQMSYPYYYSIWNSLSKEERYLAFDIAKDRFVNTVNANSIISLLDKGILIYDHSLRLMNESFTNFVLTTVSSDEALEMEIMSRKKGSWSTAFGVILLLIISLVIFISFGQQNFLNEINAFLTGIAALVGLLIRFSGFLSFGKNRVGMED